MERYKLKTGIFPLIFENMERIKVQRKTRRIETNIMDDFFSRREKKNDCFHKYSREIDVTVLFNHVQKGKLYSMLHGFH